MATLYATRGLQGCGKTTRAKAWVAENPTRRARVNRDDLRRLVHDGFWDGQNTEKLIVRMRDAMITTALKMGKDVVCDDTNLPNRTIRDLRNLARKAGAEFVVWDMTDVPLDVCIERDAQRSALEYIGKTVILKTYERFVKGRKYPLPITEPTEKELASASFAPYVPPGEPYDDAYIFDIDGTLCHMGSRDPFDETKVHEDAPNHTVIEVLERLVSSGAKIIFCSGRTRKCYDETKKYIVQHTPLNEDDFLLLMRDIGDTRKDNIVKREIFENFLRHAKVNIRGVFDDRNQVVDMWRNELGLTCFQVAPGDF